MQQRHNLRLADFAYAGAYVYFVTFCTQNRLPFWESVQILSRADPCVRPSPPGQMVAQWVKKLEEKFQGVQLIASVVMPDHVHILFARTRAGRENANLPQMMQWFENPNDKCLYSWRENKWISAFYKQAVAEGIL